MNHLKKLNLALTAAARRMNVAMAIRWPIGSTVSVFLSCRQRIPTPAQVVGHMGSRGTVRVRLLKPGKYGHHLVKNVHFEQVA